ncbi:PIN domain-containing protein [Sorangium sp. So ce134]
MKIAFDTSALVAGLHRAHTHHRRAVVWIDAVAEGRVTGLVTWHTLAELWSELTRLPIPARATPEQALEVVGRVRGVFDVRPVDPAVYDEAMKR